MRFFCVLVLAALAGVSLATLTESPHALTHTTYHKFQAFVNQFARIYTDEDESEYRYHIFAENLVEIERHNADPTSTYMKGINRFSDMTLTEKKAFRSRSWALGQSFPRECTPWNETHTSQLDEDRNSVDWRDKGIVTPVKDQGSCGSCWSFSATGSIESAVAKGSGFLFDLSEQQMVDCAGSYGNYGCGGGLMDNAYRFVAETGGQCLQRDYSYTARDGKCRAENCTAVAFVRDCLMLPENEKLMAQVLATHGPMSVAINADPFMDYESGVINGTCDDMLDHGVLLIGYGFDELSGLDYWLIKNSWGSSWGEEGYVRMARGTNMCGVREYVSFPRV